jgi:hypothetical protein
MPSLHRESSPPTAQHVDLQLSIALDERFRNVGGPSHISARRAAISPVSTSSASSDAVLLLVGAVLGFGCVGAFAFGGINQPLTPGSGREVRVWGGMHVPSVGSSIGIVTGLTRLVHGPFLWILVGFVATTTYLLVLGGQFWVAGLRRSRCIPESG